MQNNDFSYFVIVESLIFQYVHKSIIKIKNTKFMESFCKLDGY